RSGDSRNPRLRKIYRSVSRQRQISRDFLGASSTRAEGPGIDDLDDAAAGRRRESPPPDFVHHTILDRIVVERRLVDLRLDNLAGRADDPLNPHAAFQARVLLQL